MEIVIHDVGHGACSMVTTPTGARYMLDCGCSGQNGWSPSSSYRDQQIDMLVLQNLDRDHLEDLASAGRDIRFLGVFSNPHVDASALLSMKPEGLGGMHPGIFAAWKHLRGSGPGLVGRLPAAGLDEGWWYYNRYPYDFTDTNNLSVVSYFQWGNFGVLFGGDMEGEGWDALLENTDLARHLPFVRIYVAAHHGRENGKSDRLFRNMQPDLVLFSDGPVQHLTQHTADWYGSRTLGAMVHGPSLISPPQLRRVLSTRRDGTIRINVGHGGEYRVIVSRTPNLRPGRSLFMQHA